MALHAKMARSLRAHFRHVRSFYTHVPAFDNDWAFIACSDAVDVAAARSGADRRVRRARCAARTGSTTPRRTAGCSRCRSTCAASWQRTATSSRSRRRMNDASARCAGPRCTTPTWRSARGSCRSAGSRCRCSTRASSPSTTPCASAPGCSTSRTWRSSRCAGRTSATWADALTVNTRRDDEARTRRATTSSPTSAAARTTT